VSRSKRTVSNSRSLLKNKAPSAAIFCCQVSNAHDSVMRKYYDRTEVAPCIPATLYASRLANNEAHNAEVLGSRDPQSMACDQRRWAHLELRSKNSGAGAVTPLFLDAEGQRLLAAVQPFGVEKTALHIVISARPNSHEAQPRWAAALWAEDLRRHLEEESILTSEPTAPATYEAGRD
jgi:hypothetical protein